MTQVFEYKVNWNYQHRTGNIPIALRASGKVRANQQITAHLPIFGNNPIAYFLFIFPNNLIAYFPFS